MVCIWFRPGVGSDQDGARHSGGEAVTADTVIRLVRPREIVLEEFLTPLA